MRYIDDLITKYGSTLYRDDTGCPAFVHTFEVFMFHFLFQSDPTFDTSD